MAILINDNYSLQTGNKAFDARYLDVTTPWASCAAAIAGIPTYRYEGLTINISNEEWWWKDGIADEDLIKKTSSGTSNLSGATNGLQLFSGGTYVGLGGVLTQDTTIYGNYALNLGNVASGLTSISAVTPTFHVTDEGANSSISFLHDQDIPHFDVCLYAPNANSRADIVLNVDNTNGCFITSTAPNTTCCSSLSLLTTDSDVAVYNVHSSNADMHYIKETCIASFKLSCEALINRSNSALNIKTIMNYDDRSHTFITDDSAILTVLSGGTARYGSNVTLTNDCDLTHKWYVDNATGSLGGSNGLSDDGTNITLGGTLTGNTCIDGDAGSYGLTFSGASHFDVDVSTIGGGNINLLAESQVCLAGCNVSAYLGGGTLDLYDNTNTKQIQLGVGGDIRFCKLSPKSTQTNVLYINESDGRLYSGATSNVQSASNGLSIDGDNVVLGGDLTGNTTINGLGIHDMSFNNINNISLVSASGTTICGNDNILVRTPIFTLHNGVNNVMFITSSCNIFTDATNSEGFVYAANYCGVGKTNPRWIPDNEYITSLTTGSVSTASNGLTLTSNDVALGGTLTETTDICLGTNSLNIRNSGVTTCSIAEFNPTTINLCASNINSPFQISRLTASVTKTVVCNGFSGCYSSLNMSNSLLGITICGTNNASFIVTDNSTTQTGIEYAADYSNTFSNCSLITKEYSNSGDTATLSSANTYTDNCALITLISGKTYTDNCAVTTLSSANTYTDNCTLIILNSGKTYTDNCALITLNSGKTYTDNCATIILSSANTYTDNCALITLISGKTYTDNCAVTTLISSNTYTDEEIAKLTGTTSQAITGASNGLCKVGQNVTLGGFLTGNTTINPQTNSLTIGFGDNYFCTNTGRTTIYHQDNASGCYSYIEAKDYGTNLYTERGVNYTDILTQHYRAWISSCSGVAGSAFLVNADGTSDMCLTNGFTYDSVSGCSMTYADDYSGNYTCLSIPNVGWVTGQTSSSGIHTASNGLCKIGTDVKLGGTLNENTTINMLSDSLVYTVCGSGATHCGTMQFTSSVANINIENAVGHYGSVGVGAAGVTLDVSNAIDANTLTWNASCLEIRDDINSKGLVYHDDYTDNFDNCSLVSKQYVDNQSNIVAVCVINTIYTTLRNDDLITVSGLSSNQINLYSTPVLGQRLTVVDICGNALADPIVVNGNGININDSICSTINTDYGSVTYVYNGMFWSAVAFIN